MRALCKIEPGEGGIGLRDRDPRDPAADEILIRMKVAGICGTDMQIYHWAPRMARRMELPRTLGHEVSGVVEAIGAGVDNVAIGDHVSLESHIFCGACRPCRLGRAHLCINTTYPGIDIDGAFAEYLTVPARIAWVNPPGLAHETACMLEPFGIAVHASLEGSGVAGLTVLVNGCGPIGLMNVAAARALGARIVIASDLNPLRLATATRMGADRAINAADEDVARIVADMTGGAGVDVAIEYSGSEAGFRTAFECLAKGGDLRLVGAPPEAIPVDFTWWLLKCPVMHNIHGRRIWKTWHRSTRLIHDNLVDLSPVRSHVLPLSDSIRGFELILAGEAIKPLLVPDGDA